MLKPLREMKKWFRCLGIFSALLLVLAVYPCPGAAGSFPRPEMEWGGQFTFQGEASRPGEHDFRRAIFADPYQDILAGLRLKNDITLDSGIHLETHYQLNHAAGDTRRLYHTLKNSPDIVLPGFADLPSDDRRLLDLSGTLADNGDYATVHRLDRLNLTVPFPSGFIRLGRQALTWGNGLVVNPMDLFNPFAPDDFQRDYKSGDDMAVIQTGLGSTGNLQVLYVPRRDPADKRVSDAESSLAAKIHGKMGPAEVDVMAARHYMDPVIGLGSTGILGDAAWRMDLTWTEPHVDPARDYICVAANLDYSWVWSGKNFYGLAEFYYNGLGYAGDEYADAMADPLLAFRLERGEMFTRGRCYAILDIQIETHPLCRLALTSFNNISDPSGFLQPRLTWDMAENVQLITGGQIHWGQRGSEFGGFELSPGVNYVPANRFFAWMTWYF